MEYIYIIRQPGTDVCKVGVTKRMPEERMKEHNAGTGITKNNEFQFIYAAEVRDCYGMEQDFKGQFSHLRRTDQKELYFYNDKLLALYVDFIKRHPGFGKEIKTQKAIRKAVSEMKQASLPEIGLTPHQRMLESQRNAKAIQKHQASSGAKTENYKDKFPADEYYTRIEDIEKEVAFYPIEVWKDRTVFCNCDDAVGNEQTPRTAPPLPFIS